MDDSLSESVDNWRHLEHVWKGAQDGWHDVASDYFTRYFWEDFVSDVGAYQEALGTLLDELDILQSVVLDG